jgi:hypothetical protein
MKVAYGPPGQSGVQTLMHVGEDGDRDETRDAQIHEISGTVGMVSVGVWAFAYLAGDEQLRRYAFAGALGSFFARLATRPK